MMGVMVGTVRIALPGWKGKEVILADLPAGELFGEIALLDGNPRSASATALRPCTAPRCVWATSRSSGEWRE